MKNVLWRFTHIKIVGLLPQVTGVRALEMMQQNHSSLHVR